MMGMKWLASSGHRSPWGFLGMIGLVALAEFAIGLHAMSFYDVDEWAHRWTSRKASRGVQSREILCFGDSLIKLSVIPRIIQERTGKPAFNLALSGSQAPTSYFVLRRVLDSGARPVAAIVNFSPPLLRVGPRHNLTRWPVLLNPLETAKLAYWAGDPDLMGEILVNQVVPSLRGKTTIRANLMNAFGGRPDTNRHWNALGLRNWKKNDGAQLMTGSAAAHGLSDADVTKLRVGYYPEWKCHPANSAGIDRFLALARDYGVRVFWVLPPLLPALHDQLAGSGINAQLETFLSHWQAKYPNLVVVDARKKIVDLDAFWDPQHLAVEGAAAFSRALGDVLRESITASAQKTATEPPRDRWVSLPAFRLGPISPGIETIDQSRLAIQGVPKVQR